MGKEMKLFRQRRAKNSNHTGEKLLRFVIVTPVTSFFLMLFLAACVSLAEALSWTICLMGGVFTGLAVALPRQ